uniref:protein-tyrosine-phosphatase n=1 Tax=Kryptolebias marmoratus TaxID=37003 RepID=A0A3Q3F191_KRYMA
MIWQYNVKVIVMACREMEMGKRKCECYWAAAHQSAAFGPFVVTSQRETRLNEDTVVRTLTVSYQQETHSLIQHQFLSWPDHDVPPDTAGVLDLLDRARSSRGADTSPLLIHCSAGCGRTGVICALDYIHDLLVTKRITKDFSILTIVLELRSQRPSAVQTKDQYQFIFTAVIQMFERFLQASNQQLYCNQPEVKKAEKRTSSINRLSQKLTMNETYAVVNKPRKAQQLSPEPTYTVVATPSSGTRMLPSSHLYDNDCAEVPAAPVYSAVKPRTRPLTLQPSASPIYDIAAPADLREGSDYHLVSAADHDYEYVSSSELNITSFCSPGGIGKHTWTVCPQL